VDDPVVFDHLEACRRSELGDPFVRRDQLDMITARDPRDLSRVDEMLASPDVDRLIGDTEIGGDASDSAASIEAIRDLAPELGRIPPRHADLCLRVSSTTRFQHKGCTKSVGMSPRAV